MTSNREWNRRDFLRNTAAAGATAIIAPALLSSSDAFATGGGALGRIDSVLLEKLLAAAMAHGGEFAEIYVQHYQGTGVSLEEDKIRSADYGIAQGVGIRVISGIKVGYAYSDDLDSEILMQTADVAARIANGPKNPGPFRVSKIDLPNYSKITLDPQAMPIREKVRLLEAGNKTARTYDKRIIQVMGKYDESTTRIMIANTEGTLVETEQKMLRTVFSAIAEEKGDRRTGFWGGGGRIGFEWFDTNSAQSLAKEAARQAVGQLGAKDAPVGEQTVVLAGGWGGILLHEAIGHGLEADFIRKKTSLYTGKVGEKVASDLCTVIDDGTVSNLRGTINVDDEGTPSQQKVLIEDGILKGYMYDKLNAKLMNQNSTGSGRRQSFRHYPMPRMTNTFLAPGKSDPEEILKSVKKGFYAKSLGGGQVDISNGNFVFEVREGYLIEDGKATAPVKNATLIGVGPEVLKNVDMVGSDAAFDPGLGTCGKSGQSVPVGVGLPTVRIQNLTVGGTGIKTKEML